MCIQMELLIDAQIAFLRKAGLSPNAIYQEIRYSPAAFSCAENENTLKTSIMRICGEPE